jgi:hypothetical protein
VIKEKSHGCESTKPHLCFVVAPANLCLTCTLHLTGVKYSALLQANQPTFSPVLSTKLSYQLILRHTEFTGQNKGPSGVSKHTNTVNLTCVEKHVKTSEKTTLWTTPFRFIARGIVNFFLSIKRTNIYISSNKFVLIRSIYMEVRLIIFPLSCIDGIIFHSILDNFKNFP